MNMPILFQSINIMKAKMRSNIKALAEKITGKKYSTDTENFNLEDVIDDLQKFGVTIDFITIHRLLNYKNDFDIEGGRIFVRGGKSTITNYELVILVFSNLTNIYRNKNLIIKKRQFVLKESCI